MPREELSNYYKVINLPPSRCEEAIEMCGKRNDEDLTQYCCDDKISGKKTTQRWEVSKDIVSIQQTDTDAGELTTLVPRGWRGKDRRNRGARALSDILLGDNASGVIVRVPAAYGEINLFMKISSKTVL